MNPSYIKNKILNNKIKMGGALDTEQELQEDLPQGLEQDMAQDMTQGLEQDMAQGLEQDMAQGLEQDMAQGLEQGMAQGMAQGLEQDMVQGMTVDPTQILNEEFIFKNEIYNLTNEHLLEKNFSNIDPSTRYSIKLCIYSIVTEKTPSPYLRYVLNKNISENGDAEYDFPTIEFHLDSIEQPLSNEDIHQITQEYVDDSIDTRIEAELLEQCKISILDIFNFANHSSKMDFDKMFKGFFVPTTENRDTMIFVFDTTKFIPTNLVERTQTEYVWAVLYEMLCSKMWRTTPIVDSIYDNFKEIVDRNTKSLDMHHIKTKNDEYIKSPYLLYLCHFNNMKYENCFKDESATPSPTNILLPRIQHPKLGEYFIFTVEPINKEDSRTLRRFLVFFDDSDIHTNYIEESDETQIQTILDLLPTDETGFNGYVFRENDLQLWVMKNREKIVELQ